jgi:hypothetical protein
MGIEGATIPTKMNIIQSYFHLIVDTHYNISIKDCIMIKRIGYLKDKAQFIVIKEITGKEEKEIYSFERELGRYFYDKLLFQMALKNYRAIVDSIENYEAKIKTDSSLKSSREMMIELNLCILNFLTVFRAFLDHHETRIKHEYGRESQESLQLKKYCSSEFDNNPAYRFFYKYRDYCQHCGMPISSINTRLIQTDNGEEKTVLDILICKEELLKGDYWGKIVKKDIEAHDGDFNFKKLLLEFDGSIQNIHKGIMGIKKDRLFNAFKMLLSYIYRPEIGIISIGIITAQNLEEYKKGKVKIRPVIFPDFKELVHDLHELGFDSFKIEGQSFLLKTLLA